MTTSTIESVLKNKVQDIRITETDKQFTVNFRLVKIVSKMNRIGKDLRKQFPNNEIGWSGSWIIIMK